MLKPTHSGLSMVGGMLLTAAYAAGSPVEVAHTELAANPIAHIARMLSPQLVEVEDRIGVLTHGLASLAAPTRHPLSADLGYRGCRSQAHSENPSLTLDLGAEWPIETVALIPAQTESSEDAGIFPRRFSLDVSNDANFDHSTPVYQSKSSPLHAPDGIPVPIHTRATARYVRLTVQEGVNRGVLDLFGLSEVIVISHGQPVSFGASVTTVGALNTPGLWDPANLTDGRTPWGIWQRASPTKVDPGDAVDLTQPGESTTWTVQLDAAAPLDRLVVFPYQSDTTCQVAVLPEALALRLDRLDRPSGGGFDWTHTAPGTSQSAPLIIPLHGQSAQTIQLTATQPFLIGDRLIHAISEIEIWSNGRNLAAGHPVMREHAGQTTPVTALTDGSSSTGNIMPVAIWLRQLHERNILERELAPLRLAQRQLAANSELNSLWGCSMVIGLTFLIPVFLIERRRLITKDQLDQMRKRISADLHDDIGSNLGCISLIARTARKDLLRLNGPQETATDLAEMETIARESSLAMRDIVWLLERKQDSVGDLVQRMRETAGRLLREIPFTLDGESLKPSTKLSLNAKRHLFLFYKESIHNILKHSQANHVSIRVWDERDHLALEIIDNGVGIPIDTSARPATLSKLEERTNLLGGRLKITSSPDTGTRIHLLVPRAHLTPHHSCA